MTAEEHLKNGGLGDAIAQWLSLTMPMPLEMVAMDDCFGESGTTEELMKKYGLTTTHIVDAVLRVLARKNL